MPNAAAGSPRTPQTEPPSLHVHYRPRASSADPGEPHFVAGLRALSAFYAREGHGRIPAGHLEGGFPLATWMGNQRARHHRGKMSNERVTAIETAVPGFHWYPWRDAAAAMLDALTTYRRREGHTTVPSHHHEAGLPLGQWLVAQRDAWKRGTLPRGRASAILAVDPEFDWIGRPTVWETQFERHLAALQGYVAREGHAHVPEKHREEGLPLGFWLANRRNQQRAGRLDPERLRRLRLIVPDFGDPQRWSTRRGTAATLSPQFLRSLDAVAAYVAAATRQEPGSDGRACLTWINHQRFARRRGLLSQVRIDAIDARLPGFEWGDGATRRARPAS